jgi:hypothetical protein
MTPKSICPEPVLQLRRMKLKDDMKHAFLELGIAAFLFAGGLFGCATTEDKALIISAMFMCMMGGWAIWAIHDIRHAWRRMRQLHLED